MFDIGWSEFAVIAVVALIAIGPKELPGVLRMVGQWVAKARKMAGEFQGQFQEAMREAEMADLKKSFDEVREAASGFTTANVMTSLEKQANSALGIDEKTVAPTEAVTSSEATATPSSEVASSEPLVITPPNETAPVTSETHPAAVETAEPVRDAKAS
jgi:sec-independent protein translocase protein TatB